jgi:DNA polymerase-1
MMRTLLIDGDILAYKSASKAEVSIKWEESTIWTYHADEEQAKYLAVSQIESLKDDLNAKQVKITLTDSSNFRKDILPSYKDNRKDRRKPLVLKALREFLIKEYKAIVYPHLEADDVMGILATSPNRFKEDYIVCSVDKDLRQIPCYLSANGRDIVTRTEQECNRWHLIQTLTGDSVDGYTGCPSIGRVTADRLLSDAELPIKDMWSIVVDTYKKQGLEEKDALQQARVARILRYGDYDKATGKVKLWQA